MTIFNNENIDKITERNKLIEAYLPLAHKLAFEKKKHLPNNIDFEDLKSAAYYGLVDAAVKFNNEKSNFFGAYAKFRILGEIYDFVRKSYLNQKRYSVSLDEDDDNGETLASNLPQGEPCKDFNEIFDEATKTLSNQNKKIIMMYFLDDLSLKEIGRKIGVSESRVSQILKQSKEEIRIQAA